MPGLGGGAGAARGAGGRYKPQEEEFLDARRDEREKIGLRGAPSIWSKSPTRPELVVIYFLSFLFDLYNKLQGWVV